MAKDLIKVDGQEVIVREDTARAYRFVHWGVITAVICLAIIAVLCVTLLMRGSRNGTPESPVQRESTSGR